MSFQVKKSYYGAALLSALVRHESGFALKWAWEKGANYLFVRSECCGEEVSVELWEGDMPAVKQDYFSFNLYSENFFKTCNQCEKNTRYPASTPTIGYAFLHPGQHDNLQDWLELFFDSLEVIIVREELKELFLQLAEEGNR